MKAIGELPYRDCAGAALFNQMGEVFIGRRISDGDGADSKVWQMPQGGMDKGEGAEDAARRELFEETSVRSVRLVGEIADWLYYDLPAELVGVALRGKYRGQRQKWFAYEFDGDESEIDVLLPGGGLHRAEFDGWRWEQLEKLPELIVPFKRDVYARIVSGFLPIRNRLRTSQKAGS